MVRQFNPIPRISTCDNHLSIHQPTITHEHNLKCGYGVALWYYNNYLQKFKRQNQISDRIKQFMSVHRVSLPEKLYILCPLSCTVDKYIDTPPYMERRRFFQI